MHRESGVSIGIGEFLDKLNNLEIKQELELTICTIQLIRNGDFTVSIENLHNKDRYIARVVYKGFFPLVLGILERDNGFDVRYVHIPKIKKLDGDVIGESQFANIENSEKSIKSAINIINMYYDIIKDI